MARACSKILLVLIGLLLPGAAQGTESDAGKPAATIVGVLDFEALRGASPEIARSMTSLLVKEVERLGEVRVVGETELRKLLVGQKEEDLVSFDWTCPAVGFAERREGKELAVRWVVAGRVSKFGKMYILSMKLFDLKNRMVAGRVARRIWGGPDKVKEELEDATQMLFEDAADRVGLEIVVKTVITTARRRMLIEESPSAVTVITREDIEASGADNIPNLLRLVPGLDVIVSTSALQAITSRLNWTYQGNHHLVLIDGREINFDPLGFPVWEGQPIFLEDIERIEVIRGPASALYGANAFAGMVSITTREIPGKTTAGLFTRLGETGRTVAGLRASTRLSGWGISLLGGGDLSAEFSDPQQNSKQVWKFRALAERRWAGSNRFSIDAGIAYGEAPFSTPIGKVQSVYNPYTVRLGYESEDLRGQLYWIYVSGRVQNDSILEYNGMQLATFVPAPNESHVIDAQLQWTPPNFFEPLLLVVGGGARAAWVGSDYMLDAASYSNPNSGMYQQAGVSRWEVRSGAFIHAEYTLTDRITLTGGTRIDYNTHTDWFISPRLVAVVQPAADHYLRAGVGRSFRKPSFLEMFSHLMVEFPEGSPIQGGAQDSFQEFMTRVGGNSKVTDEELLAFEAGYVGRLLNGRLSISLDLYYNRYRNRVMLVADIVAGDMQLPDLDQSSFMFKNQGPDLDIIGGELGIRFSPSRHLSFLASWSHRQVYDYSIEGFSGESPKNLITLGGRFNTALGLSGSLYAFARSELWDINVENPAGFLEALRRQHMDNVVLLMGKLGQRLELGPFQLEAGVKLLLPVSPFSAPHFRYYEAGGGIAPDGRPYGAEQLGRMLTGYLEGTF